ncbi:MAG: plasmid mobilization relaxosome protein MobC [Enterocloster sp.]
MLRLLRITGNNLNQYAKQANATGSIYWSDIEELKHGSERNFEGNEKSAG